MFLPLQVSVFIICTDAVVGAPSDLELNLSVDRTGPSKAEHCCQEQLLSRKVFTDTVVEHPFNLNENLQDAVIGLPHEIESEMPFKDTGFPHQALPTLQHIMPKLTF